MIGHEIRHINLGLGKVRSADEEYIEVDFYEGKDNPKTFKSVSIYKYFSKLYIDSELKGIEEAKQSLLDQLRQEAIQRENELKKQAALKVQQEKELAAKKNFEKLKVKYHVENHRETSPVSNLYRILLDIESDERLEEEHISWLKQNRLHHLLVRYYENRYKISNDPWELIKAASCWRNLDPQKTLELSEQISINHPNAEPNVKAAALTTKGGAYRDLNDLQSADQCAHKALGYYESRYPYSLLGAIAFQLGNLDQGEAFFQKAAELGSSKKEEQNHMRSSLEKSDPDVKTKIAEHLLKRDPQKFHWAMFYLEQ